jgi:DNA-binding response OmpR family regulator
MDQILGEADKSVPGVRHTGQVLEVQDVVVDPESRRAWRAGNEIRLSRKEFDLLHALISRPGEIVSRDTLMREVWQTNFWTSAKTIDVHLGWLRRKLGDDPRKPELITTLRGRGLRFETTSPYDLPETAAAAPLATDDLPTPVAAAIPEVDPPETAPA